MTFDRFGEELYPGDVVAYADTDESGMAVMHVYIVTELVDTHTCLGQLMSGPYAGAEFYLTDSMHRCAYLYSSPDEDEEEEDDEFSEKPTYH